MGSSETYCDSCGTIVTDTMIRCPHCQGVLRSAFEPQATVRDGMIETYEVIPEFEPEPETKGPRWRRSIPMTMAFFLLLVAVILITVTLLSNTWFHIHLEYGSGDDPMMVDWDMGLSETHFLRQDDPRWFGFDIDGTFDSDILIEDASYLSTQGLTEVLMFSGLIVTLVATVLIGHLALGPVRLRGPAGRYLPIILGVVSLVLMVVAIVNFNGNFPDQVVQELDDYRYGEFGDVESYWLGNSFYLAVTAMVLVLIVILLLTYRTWSDMRAPVIPGPIFGKREESSPQRMPSEALPMLIGSLLFAGCLLLVLAMTEDNWEHATSSVYAGDFSEPYSLETDYGLYKMYIIKTYSDNHEETYDVEYDEDHSELSDEGAGLTTMWLLLMGVAIAALAAVFAFHIVVGAFGASPRFRRYALAVLGLAASTLVIVALLYFEVMFTDGIYKTQESDDRGVVLSSSKGVSMVIAWIGAISIVIASLMAVIWVSRSVTLPPFEDTDVYQDLDPSDPPIP